VGRGQEGQGMASSIIKT